MKNSLAIIGFYIIRAFAFLHCTKLLNVVYFQALLYMYIYNFLKTPRLYIIYSPKLRAETDNPTERRLLPVSFATMNHIIVIEKIVERFSPCSGISYFRELCTYTLRACTCTW